MKKVGIFVVVLVAVVGLQMYRQNNSEKKVLEDMKSIIAQMGVSAEDTTYLYGVLERVHPNAFTDAYDVGGRRRSAKLNERQYIQDVFDRMIETCNRQGNKYLVEPLQTTRDGILEGLDK